MTLASRRVSKILLAVTLGLAAPMPAHAQLVLTETETLDFDRPESWALKYYASLAQLTGMNVPRKRALGEVELGFEGGQVPQLTDEQRRIGFNGTKLENVNRTRLIGRLRGSVGLGSGWTAELGYTPPIEVGGARPHIFALAVERPIELSPSLRLAVRGHGQAGAIEADITCSDAEVAAGGDPRRNPFQCIAPSEDQTRQRVVGLELVAGYDGRSRLKPYAGIGLNHMDLEIHLDARYSGGRVEDHTVQLTSGTTVSATAGLTYEVSGRLRVTAGLFYSWLSIVRPPSNGPANEGFLNGRVLLSYRLH